MKKTKVTKKDVLFLSISFFVVVVCWIGFSVYHEIVTTTISEDLQMRIIPIESKFDTSVIDKLKTREKVLPIFTKTDSVDASSSAEEEPAGPEDPLLEEVTPTEEPPISAEEDTTIIEPSP